ncbi:Bug family tripartite tricarboxylate transporter substrate binding protein [Ramlibacter sp.]|uniref:Bug family tripartite tricarboxylate transporter substrate binding protein n=1 Tax=Ramlibacter sp. TaxID=1917967 RepID=UPI003D0E8B28
MTKRRSLLALALAAASLFASGAALAQTYPDRPIRLVVPYAAGGSADGMARLIGQHLGDTLGQPVVIDNKAGGGTLIGAEFVKAAKPDGYTLFLGTSSTSLLMLRKGGSPVDFRKDLEPVMAFAESVFVILGGINSPFKTFPEMLAWAKANPGKLTYSVPGPGSTSHLLGEYIASVAGVKMTVVPYKGGGPASVGLMGGEVMASVDGIGPTNVFVRDGKMNLLATTGAQRSPVFPNTPIIGETLQGMSAGGWIGLASAPGTPKPIIDRLHAALTTVIAKPDVKARIESLSLKPMTSTPAEYRGLIAGEIDKWAKVVRDANLTID